MEANNKQNVNSPNGGKKSRFNISWIYTIIILALLGSLFFNKDVPSKTPYSTFETYIEKGYVESVTVFSTNVVVAKISDSALTQVFGTDEESYPREHSITINIPSVEEFSKYLSQQKKENPAVAGMKVDYEEGRNYWYLFLTTSCLSCC